MADYTGGDVHKNAKIYRTPTDTVTGDITNIAMKEHTIHIANIGDSGQPADLGGKTEVGVYEGREYRYGGGGGWVPFHPYEKREYWPYPA